MSIRAVIVEDEEASRARIRTLASGFKGIDVIAECADGLTAVETIVDSRPDLVLLDVQLPELNGFEVVDALPHGVRPGLLFITAFDDFAIRAFDESAIDYVLKPFSAARFTRALGRAVDRLRADRNVGAVAHAVAERIVQIPESRAGVKPLRRFVARTGNKVYFVRAQDVDWIDVTDNYLRLHTSGRTHLIRGTIADITLRLDPEQFVRVNRGAIVRVDTIATIEAIAPATYRLTLNDGTRVSSSRTYADFVRALMNP